jgi:hypothetical protein
MRDRIGEIWNNLTIIKFDKAVPKKQGGYRHFWICRCICGTTKSIVYGNLQSNSVKSCGCLKSKLISNKNTLHGHAKNNKVSTEFKTWSSMIFRCYNSNCNNYKYYGGRGIQVCDRWKNSFENFLEDMGLKPSKSYSIDRIDNNGNYELSNCKWSTKLEQSNNQSSNRIIIDITGKEYSSISVAAKSINMKQSTLYYQLIGKNPNKTNLKFK